MGESGRSTLRQEQLHLHLDSFQIHLSSILSADFPVRIDQISHRKPEHTPVEFSDLFISHRDWVIHTQLCAELAHQSRIIIHGDANDLQPS